MADSWRHRSCTRDSDLSDRPPPDYCRRVQLILPHGHRCAPVQQTRQIEKENGNENENSSGMVDVKDMVHKTNKAATQKTIILNSSYLFLTLTCIFQKYILYKYINII